MVHGRIDGGQFIETSFETIWNSSTQFTIGSRVIQALEKDKVLWVCGSGLLEGGEFFNNDMRVTLDLTLIVKLLRGSEVIGICIDEKSSLHVLDSHLNSESLIRLERSEVFWESEFG